MVLLRTIGPGFAALFAAILLAHCGSPENSEQKPQAKLTLVHMVSDLGNVEILLDGEVTNTLAPNTLQSGISVDIGPYALALRNPGAQTPTHEESLMLREQSYFIAFSGLVAQGINTFIVDSVPPTLEEGGAAVQAVSLIKGNYAFDVKVGNTEIATNLAYQKVSRFQVVTPGEIQVVVYQHGATYPLDEVAHGFDDGSATMILLRGKDAADTDDMISFLNVTP